MTTIQEHSTETRIPEQPVAAAPKPAPKVDHVTRHGLRCWWDVEECRWDCSGD
jgi:hypothetical protein